MRFLHCTSRCASSGRIVNSPLGHASTQSPHAVHFAGSTTGSPVSFMRMASNVHDALAVGEAEASPGAALAAAGHRRRRARRSASRDTRPACTATSRAAGAQQPRHALRRASPASTPRKSAIALCAASLRHRALRRRDRARPPPLGERAAARAGRTRRSWRSAASAPRLDARILPHPEPLVGERDEDARRPARCRRGSGSRAESSSMLARAHGCPRSPDWPSSQAAMRSTASVGAHRGRGRAAARRARRTACARGRAAARRSSPICHALMPPMRALGRVAAGAHRETLPRLAARRAGSCRNDGGALGHHAPRSPARRTPRRDRGRCRRRSAARTCPA